MTSTLAELREALSQAPDLEVAPDEADRDTYVVTNRRTGQFGSYSPLFIRYAADTVAERLGADPTLLRQARAARQATKRTGPATTPQPADPSVAGASVTADPATASVAPKGPNPAERVIDYVEQHYDLGVTPDGHAFAVPKSGPRLPVMLGDKGGALRARVVSGVRREAGLIVSDRALSDAFQVVLAQAAELAETTDLHLRCQSTSGLVVIDLGQPGNSRCVVISPLGWHVADEPPSGVLFRRPGSIRPLPDPVPGGSLEPLRSLLGFSHDDDRWRLVRGWLVASVFGETARPMLALLGAAGAGKSFRGQTVVNVIDPRERLGSSFGKNLHDEEVKAFGRYLVGWDNLSSVSESMSDFLCRLVTGDSVEKRRLYSDAELVSVAYRRTGVLTAIALPAFRADALERLIPIHLDPMEASQRRSERAMQRDFERAHPAILGALCDGIATVLQRLPEVTADENLSGPRMLDYFLTLLAYDPECAAAYQRSAEAVLRDAAHDDDFVMTVRDWLAAKAPSSISGTATDCLIDLKRWWAAPSPGQHRPNPYLPPDGARFSRALVKATQKLAAVGVSIERHKGANGARTLTLTFGDIR